MYHIQPKAVLKVHNEMQISHVIKQSIKHKVPLTFRAAGTSLNGQGLSEHVLVIITNGWTRYKIENRW